MTKYIPIGKIKLNPANPRIIRDAEYRELVRSVAQFPKMLYKRGVVVDGQMMCLGGNQRWRSILDILKMPESDLRELTANYPDAYTLWEILREKKAVPEQWIVDGSDFTEEEIRRFIIVDNLQKGEHDWDALANGWDAEELADWGVDVPGYGVSPDGLTDSFSLPDGDREPFQQITFTLADEQATIIKNAVDDIKKTDEYKYAETYGNENSNGNALCLIVSAWAGQRI
jgi:hypothetical protein